MIRKKELERQISQLKEQLKYSNQLVQDKESQNTVLKETLKKFNVIVVDAVWLKDSK